jgi:Protein of unknown function (DUF3300)
MERYDFENDTATFLDVSRDDPAYGGSDSATDHYPSGSSSCSGFLTASTGEFNADCCTDDSDQLDALVAPIALYPDALVAQVLGAAAAPDQVAIADYWLGQNKTITGTALAQAVDAQTWDPSVKALTQFPSVLNVLFLRLFVVDIL